MRYIWLLLSLIAASGCASKWVQLSDTDQGPRFVNVRSSVRQGDFAFIDTELRMEPVIKRRESFDCDRHLILVESYIIPDPHQPKMTLVGRDWISASENADHSTMLEMACGGNLGKVIG